MVRYETLRLQLIAQRKLLGLSQRELAHRMGVETTALNQLENGSRPNPTCETLAIWCRALGGRLDIGVEFDQDRETCWLRSNSPTPTCSCTGEECNEDTARKLLRGVAA